MLDAILCPEWEYRYYSYNCKWSPGEEMASMRNGSGDDWFMLFGPFGAGIKGLAHEYIDPVADDYLRHATATIPPEFKSFVEEPAFGWEWISFCYWRRPDDSSWTRLTATSTATHTHEDGSSDFLALLHEGPESYVAFAEEYFEVAVPTPAVEAMFRGDPLTVSLVKALNPNLNLSDLVADAQEIGYAVRSDA
jgi:hypothetical protein